MCFIIPFIDSRYIKEDNSDENKEHKEEDEEANHFSERGFKA